MNSDLTFICKTAANWLLPDELSAELGEPPIGDFAFEFELDHEVPIWDDLTLEQKIEAIQYVVKNENNEDFGHSGCCKAVHQATAYFLVEYFKSLDSEIFFDDLDFMMADNVPNKQTSAMLGIGDRFFG